MDAELLAVIDKLTTALIERDKVINEIHEDVRWMREQVEGLMESVKGSPALKMMGVSV